MSITMQREKKRNREDRKKNMRYIEKGEEREKKLHHWYGTCANPNHLAKPIKFDTIQAGPW